MNMTIDYNIELEKRVVELEEKLEAAERIQQDDSHRAEVCMRLISNYLMHEVEAERHGKKKPEYANPENGVDRQLRLVANDIKAMYTPRMSVGPSSQLQEYIYQRLVFILQNECTSHKPLKLYNELFEGLSDAL